MKTTISIDTKAGVGDNNVLSNDKLQKILHIYIIEFQN
jgi:hypothetical protein